MSTSKRKEEIRFQGIPISPGITVARVCLFCESQHNILSELRPEGQNAESEIERLDLAHSVVIQRLKELHSKTAKEIGKAEAEIFTTQHVILDDRRLRERLYAGIRADGLNAESSVIRVLGAYEARIRAVTNDSLRERSSDIGEVRQRLLAALGNTAPGLRCAGTYHCRRGRGRIVVSRELTPGLTIELDTEHVLGFVTEHGGITSHAAILSRALGIPAVSGIPGIRDIVECGTEVMVNGDNGEVILWPSSETVAHAKVGRAVSHQIEILPPIPGIQVLANISLASDIHGAKQMRAEGIGLYRTEFEFMAAGRVLNEEEQTERYSAVLKAMAGAPVYIRLIDLGGDKPAPFLSLPKEENPALGFRGARLLLAHPQLIRDQARAIARASHIAPLNLIYPMITDVTQFMKLKTMVTDSMADLHPNTIRHGVMLEVPAACIAAEELLAVADFGSIGTNDLFQYLFAIDRNNEHVAADFKPDHPVFWKLISQVVAAARKEGKSLSVCGEIAGWPDYALKLMELGIRTISVSPRTISRIRRVVGAVPRSLRPMADTAITPL